MATMLPSIYPKPPNQEDPEFEVFEILRKLPDHYLVFYSRKFKGGRSWKEECEIDFIIFDRKQFMICLEVKGGMIDYDGREDRWHQNGKRLNPSPDRQASTGMHAVLSFLGPDAKNLNLGWALGFPNCSLPANARPAAGLPTEIIMDQERFNDIEPAINAAEGYYQAKVGRPGIAPPTANAIEERLTRGMSFVSKVGVRIARDYQQILETTEEQMKVLEDLEINEKTVVRGFAGTGKTALATEFARRLDSRNQSVLLLFYNRLIAKKVARSFDRNSNITCTRFFKFAKSVIDAKEPQWWRQNYRKDDDSFWADDVPLKLLDLPDDALPKFDAIIIDEGQDFKPDWFEFLQKLLKKPNEGRFVVFYDENQDVFGRWSDLPWGGSNVARKQLTENCRNTKAIISYLNEKCPTGMTPFNRSPQGENVVERRVDTPEEAKAEFLNDVEAILAQGVEPGQIVVLLNQPKQESCVAEVTKIRKHKFEGISRYYNDRSKSIQFTNINMFKGLEADVVFVMACEEYEADRISKTLYSQSSRARVLLYVYVFNQSA